MPVACFPLRPLDTVLAIAQNFKRTECKPLAGSKVGVAADQATGIDVVKAFLLQQGLLDPGKQRAEAQEARLKRAYDDLKKKMKQLEQDGAAADLRIAALDEKNKGLDEVIQKSTEERRQLEEQDLQLDRDLAALALQKKKVEPCASTRPI